MPKCPQSHQANHSPEARKAANQRFNFDHMPATGFMRQPQVLGIVPFSAATLWRKCRDGDFPKPVKLSDHVTAWRVGDVREWITAKCAA